MEDRIKAAVFIFLFYSLAAKADLSLATDRDFSDDIKNNACVHFLDREGNPTLECEGIMLESDMAVKLQQAYSPELQIPELVSDVTGDPTHDLTRDSENVPVTDTP